MLKNQPEIVFNFIHLFNNSEHSLLFINVLHFNICMENKIETLEKSVAILAKEVTSISELLGAGFKKVESNFDSIKKEIYSLHSKVDILNKKVDNLEGNTTDGFGDVGLKLETLSEEISKIGIITKYDEEYKNLQRFN